MAKVSASTHESKARLDRKPILLVGGDKGGVGKSFMSRATTSWLLARGEKVVGFDGDARNPHLERYLGGSMTVERPPLRSVDGWSQMYQEWEKADAGEVILVDLPGNVGDMVDGETPRLPRVANALGRHVISIWVGSEEEDSIWLLRNARGLTEGRRTLFVMNGRYGADPSRFELWQTSKTRAEFLADGGVETLLPVLPIFPRTAITRSRSPFHDVSGAGLTLTEKVDFDMWWEAVNLALTPLAKMMEKA